MSNQLEKYAQDLAVAATTGKRESLISVAQPFMKEAAPDLSALLQDPTVQRYLLGGLGGAGLGALVGSMQPNKKKRNALSYGLMGGLGGLGLAHLLGYSGGPAGTKPLGDQSANETIAAARAAGMTPIEYLKNRRGPDADAAYNAELNSQLTRDGGLFDRFGGAAALEGTRRAVRSGYNRIFGTRDAAGKLVPPRSVFAPVSLREQVNAVRSARRDARNTAQAIQRNQMTRADADLATARRTIGDSEAALRNNTSNSLKDIRQQLRAQRNSAGRLYEQALAQRPGAGYGENRPGQTNFSTFKPSPALTGPLAELDQDYQAKRQATRAATDAAKLKVRELATGRRAETSNLTQQMQAATEQHDLSRLQALHGAGRRMGAARNATRGGLQDARWTARVRNPLARVAGTALNLAPAVIGATQGLSGLSGSGAETK